jgi:uncharacterized repeat protein (TIGR03803 family)
MDALGNLAVLHAFAGAPDGAFPTASLIQAADGSLYGTTSAGGDFDHGSVFRMTLGGSVTIVHSFTGLGDEGAYPNGALVQANDGNLYGTTAEDSSSRHATIFRLTPDGTYTVLHVFETGTTNPSHPGTPALIQAADGQLYGVFEGFDGNFGEIFRISLDGQFAVLHRFAGGLDGAHPHGALLQAVDGTFYGTTNEGGPSDGGTVFHMQPNGDVAVLHAFTGTADGAYPSASLVQTPDGLFLGTTALGGAGFGTVFQIAADGTTLIRHQFVGSDGAYPWSELIQAFDGGLYGVSPPVSVTLNGGVYRLRR